MSIAVINIMLLILLTHVISVDTVVAVDRCCCCRYVGCAAEVVVDIALLILLVDMAVALMLSLVLHC
jgi:hypothetical protein